MSLPAPVSAAAGGPDACGYSWTDSTSAPPNVTFEWTEIKDNGIRIGNNDWIGSSDDGYLEVGLGFSILYYDSVYSVAYIGTNGYVSFDIGYADYILPPIPDPDRPNNAVYAFGRDLSPGASTGEGGVYYSRLASPGRLIVEWFQVPHYGGTDPVTFEIILHESGEIWFQYLALSGPVSVVGIENADGSGALSYGTTLSDELAIRFSTGELPPSDAGVEVLPCVQVRNAVPGRSEDAYLRVWNSGTAEDSFDMEFASPTGWFGEFYEASGVTPLPDTDGDGVPDTGSLTPDASFVLLLRVGVPGNATAEEHVVVSATSSVDLGISDRSTVVFSVPPAFLRLPLVDVGIDTNGNGKSDFLSVTINLTVVTRGTFVLFVRLHDPTYALNLRSETAWDFPPGPTAVELLFDGWIIRKTGLEGPYLVNVTLREGFTARLLDSVVHMTQPYSHEDFEPVPTISSSRLSTTPVIDGNITAFEWDDATVVDLSIIPRNSLPSFLYVKNDVTTLYIAYDAFGDWVQDAYDMGSIAFDTGNDAIPTDRHEDQFAQGGWAPNRQAHYVFNGTTSSWVVEDSPYDPGLPDHGGLQSDWEFGPSPKSATSHRMYEFAVPLALLEARPGDTIGFFGGSHTSPGVYDDTSFAWSMWPMFDIGPLPLYAYGYLVLAGDTIPPTVTVISPRSGTLFDVDSVDVTWEATDEGFGLDHLELTLDGDAPRFLPPDAISFTLTDLADGEHAIEITATDRLGNQASDLVLLTIDTTAPTLMITLPADGALSADPTVTIEWTADDPASGIERFEISLDADVPIVLPASASSITFDDLQDGPHTARLEAHDRTGRVTALFTTFIVDTTRPSVRMTSSLPTFLTTGSVTLTWISSDVTTGVERLEIRVDGGAPSILEGTATGTTVTDLADGEHVVEVTSVDWVGNRAAVTLTVVVDTTAPTLEVISPDPGAYLASPGISASWIAADATAGLGRFLVSIDGTSTYSLSSTATEFLLMDVRDGVHVIIVTAVDLAGHSTSASLAVTVDTIAPSMSILTPSPGAVVGSSALTVTWATADATSGIDHIELTADSGPIQFLPASSTSAVLRGVEDGSHAITIRVVDRAGNSAIASVAFRVDTQVLSPSGPYGNMPILTLVLATTTAVVAGSLLVRRRYRRPPPRRT